MNKHLPVWAWHIALSNELLCKYFRAEDLSYEDRMTENFWCLNAQTVAIHLGWA